MLDKIRNLNLAGHVGFDSLPDQLVTKSVQKGFIFNILCIGKSSANWQLVGDNNIIIEFIESLLCWF